MATQGPKSTYWGRLCRAEVKELVSSMSLVTKNGYSHHHHPLVCSMAGTAHLTVVIC